MVNHVANVLLQVGMAAGLLGSMSQMVFVMTTGGQPDRLLVPLLPFTVIVLVWSETHPVESSGDTRRVE